MAKKFNVTGICIPERHYMVDTGDKVERIISNYIREGKYFTINRARQYGKTTMLHELEKRLLPEFVVIRISFEAADDYFTSSVNLVKGLTLDIGESLERQGIDERIVQKWYSSIEEELALREFGKKITRLCAECDKKVVFMIDEVDKSSDNQLFLSFLGLLRAKYLEQMQGGDKTFWSVILAGVYDVKNLKLKLHPEQESKYNSPWNIAVDFNVDLSFSTLEIEGMLKEYEADIHTGMDVKKMAEEIYAYTSGYPYLVSRICQLMDEGMEEISEYARKEKAWTPAGFQKAIKILLKESNTLFDDMLKKLTDYVELKEIVRKILYNGRRYSYESGNFAIQLGTMFGFLKEEDGVTVISNRIFEMKLYNWLISEEETNSEMYQAGALEKPRFTKNGVLDMDLVMQKFYEYFTEIYADAGHDFLEENGRRLFLLYLKPIINGTGNYYVEARTRDMRRTDVIVDYLGRQYIVELKIWRGQEYRDKGMEQLAAYLDDYHQEKGYLLSFNFNKSKQTGIRKWNCHGKEIMEIMV